MPQTRKNIIDRVRRLIYGGYPTDDAQITVNLVNSWLNDAIAAACVSSFWASYKVDQVGSVADGFYMTFSPFSLSKDSNTGYYNFTLPALPLSLPKSHSISNVFVISGSKVKTECSRIDQRELGLMFEVPLDSDEVYYWVEQQTLYLWSKRDISAYTAYVRMPYGSASTNTLTSIVNVPDDLVPQVIEYLVKAAGEQRRMPSVNQNEGIEKANTTP